MYDESIKLFEEPDDDLISLCIYNEHDQLFALGERINARFEEAYMNGYNWEALISFYVAKHDPSLLSGVEPDPEAGMFSAHMSYSAENLEKMKRYEALVRSMLKDEGELMAFIAENEDEIAWD